MFVRKRDLIDLSQRCHNAGRNGIERERVFDYWRDQQTLRDKIARVRWNLKWFIGGSLHGRPMYCHACGKRMSAGTWIQRVRVPALPWQMWRHRGRCP